MNLRSLANTGVAAYLAVLIISLAFAFEDSGESMHWATQALIENRINTQGQGWPSINTQRLLFPKADVQITKYRVKLAAAFGQKQASCQLITGG